MLESADGVTSKKIKDIREELRRFQSQQSDAVVQFHCIAVDTNLGAALDGQNDESFREILASNVEQLAHAVRAARLR